MNDLIYDGQSLNEIDLNDVSICDYFPKLLPGNNQLNFSAENVSITKITIIPRWRRL